MRLSNHLPHPKEEEVWNGWKEKHHNLLFDHINHHPPNVLQHQGSQQVDHVLQYHHDHHVVHRPVKSQYYHIIHLFQTYLQ